MKTTISNLSGERLEAEISKLYYEGESRAPGVRLQETGLLGMLWQEFDERLEAGAIDPDSDYQPKEWREGYYE